MELKFEVCLKVINSSWVQVMSVESATTIVVADSISILIKTKITPC